MPNQGSKNKRHTAVRMPKTLKRRLQKIADAKGIALSALILEILESDATVKRTTLTQEDINAIEDEKRGVRETGIHLPKRGAKKKN